MIRFPALRHPRQGLLLLVVVLFASACGVQSDTAGPNNDPAATTPPTVEAEREPLAAPGDPSAPKPEPVPYIPAGRPGSGDAYGELVARLEEHVPAELRNEVPWPDLRNPNPIVAQVEIFELWIWMAATLPEPRLVEIMAAPGGPSRDEVVSVFGRIAAENVFETRTGSGYEAFDHLVVTFESAGLPLWLGYDVPADAVVVYYRDRSGPIEITDQDSGATLDLGPAVPARTWLSIMVPTDVGWRLWRDQLIEPSDSELEVPDVPPPPSADTELRTPEL